MNVTGVVVGVVLVAVALVDVVDVAGLVAVMFVGVTLVDVVVVSLSVVLVAVALVNVVDVAGFVAVMLVGVTLVDIVLLHLMPPKKPGTTLLNLPHSPLINYYLNTARNWLSRLKVSIRQKFKPKWPAVIETQYDMGRLGPRRAWRRDQPIP